MSSPHHIFRASPLDIDYVIASRSCHDCSVINTSWPGDSVLPLVTLYCPGFLVSMISLLQLVSCLVFVACNDFSLEVLDCNLR